MSFAERDPGKILNRQMRSLSRRSKSIFETREKLAKLDLAEEDVDLILTKLMSYGFLDDSRYAREYLRSKLRSGYGLLRVRRDLKERGVDGSLIAQAIDDEDNDLSEEAVFREMLEKRIRAKGEPQNQKDLKSLSDFLMRRGFHSDMVRKGLEPYFNKVFR